MLSKGCQLTTDIEREGHISCRGDREFYETKRQGRFFKRFENNYGHGSVDTFKEMIEGSYSTLADVARYFGFSREYARLVYKKIYGFPYTETHKKKLETKRKIKEELKQKEAVQLKGKRKFYIDRVMEKAESLGFTTIMRSTGNPNNILINDCKVNIKGASRPIQVRKNWYFSISRTNLDRKDCDFFVCVCRSNGNDTYYVIPYYAMPKFGANIPVDNYCAGEKTPYSQRNSKYLRFKEAWGLLAIGFKILNFTRPERGIRVSHTF